MHRDAGVARTPTCALPVLQGMWRENRKLSSFKAALRWVLTEEEARELDSVYGARSQTVHAGLLHGGETVPGISAQTWSTNSDRLSFRWKVLWKLRRAAALLFLRCLRPGSSGELLEV